MPDPTGFFARAEALRATGRPFAVATVIAVRGSASAKTGSKALIDEEGRNVWGWVGGGCAETFVARNALEAIAERRPRIVQADLDDEIFGLGMPCGGIMDVFIDPQCPPEELPLRRGESSETLAHLAETLGLAPRFADPRAAAADGLPAEPLEKVVHELAESLAMSRGASFQSLRSLRGIYREELGSRVPRPTEFLILGSSRITEELAAWGALVKWPVRVYGPKLDPASYPKGSSLQEGEIGYGDFHVKAGSAVVVASHHRGDHEFIRTSLNSGAAYVGLVASPKRAGLVFEHLKSVGVSENSLRTVYAPTGFDLACRTPREIALSVVAEIIGLRA